VVPGLEVRGVEVPFSALVGDVEVEGTVDDLAEKNGQLIVIEHKTTSSDISAGGAYSREVVLTNLQATMYLAAFPGATILYDVIRKPAFRKLREGKPNEETDDELVARCLEAMAKDPARYFARFKVIRLEVEKAEFARDIAMIDRLRRGIEHPRNPSSCHAFGRMCGYFPVCWEGASLDDDTKFTANLHGVIA
jgi:hypothetical protein